MTAIPIPVLAISAAVFIFLLFIMLALSVKKRQTRKINAEMSSWINKKKDDLLMSWGPPTSVFPMDNGQEIWSYNKIRQASEYIIRNSPDNTHVAEHDTLIKRQFFINEYGIIFNTRWENF